MTEERTGYEIRLPHGILYAVKNSKVAGELAAQGKPVLGVLTKENQNEAFTGVKYLCEEEALSDREYLDRICCRMQKIPCFILSTERCIIRETTEEDAEDFYRIYDDPAAKAYMEPLYENPVDEKIYLQNYRENIYGFYEYGIWTVTDKKSDRVIGRAGLDPVEIPGITKEGGTVPQLGYIIGKEYRGRGIAEEVCREILNYGFEKLGFSRIYALTHKDNSASVHLLCKLQFTKKGPSKESPSYVLYEKNR